MKITISPTEDQGCETFPHFAVSVEFPHDDSFTAEQAVSMFFQCLLAFGITKEAILKEFDDFKL